MQYPDMHNAATAYAPRQRRDDMGLRELGDRIKERREALGLSQGTVGQRVGRDQTAISRLENARRMPEAELLNDVARVLGLNVADLIQLAGFQIDVEERETERLFVVDDEQITEDEWRFIQQTLRAHRQARGK